ncbi:RICIN domain-containing protein [Hymenobacter weizhouensis]|uniref:RICIN domain-containing protein n=1 Tax=Hymenobacter sp. YIM 151500-1 TaxID=2987689 RepID=UPI002225C2EF|nr:RICIN domain-containing protein [Hymenobacter sp. YIM 151500-1]UYZ63627.1 RICIN domain-containing protein [Hymenobacter sp. YIM 151500-1]
MKLFFFTAGALAAGLLAPAPWAQGQIVSGAYYSLKAQHTGKALDVAQSSQADRADVLQSPYHGTVNQQWQFVDVGGGYYKVLARHSSKALDVSGASSADGAKVWQYADNGTAAQRWKLEDAGNGYYRLRAQCSGKVLEVEGGRTDNGAPVQQGPDQSCPASAAAARRAAPPAVTLPGVVAYPVPARDNLTVAIPAGSEATVSLLDGAGRTVLTRLVPAGATSTRVPVSQLPAGAYSLRVQRGRLAHRQQVLVGEEVGGSGRADAGAPAAAPATADVVAPNGCSQLWKIEPVDGSTPPAGGTPSAWTERILNANGSINWSEYENIAANYNRPSSIDYRYGPKYSDFHAASSPSIPTLPQPYASGMFGDVAAYGNKPATWEWFAMSGQLLFAPEATAPAEAQRGAATMRNGSVYLTHGTPEYLFDLRALWTPDFANGYNNIPEDAFEEPAWQAALSGASGPPVATVRAHGPNNVTGYLLFQNGLVGATGTGNDGYFQSGGPLHRPFVRLGAGKVPTGGAVTQGNEWLLVTVWDAAQRKGQLAVIAIKGRVVAQETQYHWGFPNWPTITGMKLLGYVDLPMAAPTSVSAAGDYNNASSGRGNRENVGFDLSSQQERDYWYNWNYGCGGFCGGEWKKTPRAGYAIVASRSENKVVFVDLQPLLSYHRQMYFTSAANYDQTKNEGPADNQWPYTFAQVPRQMPTVAQTLTVPQPTAVAAGTGSTTAYERRDDGVIYGQGYTFHENAYVASLDGTVRMYKVGDLITPASGTSSVGAPFKTFAVGKNPTHIDYGFQGDVGSDLFISCRGDRAVYWALHNGTVRASLQDGRLQDPVHVAVSHFGRYQYGTGILTVLDYTGRQVVNYRYMRDLPDSPKVPLANPQANPFFEFGYATPVPGWPFMYSLTEVI